MEKDVKLIYRGSTVYVRVGPPVRIFAGGDLMEITNRLLESERATLVGRALKKLGR